MPRHDYELPPDWAAMSSDEKSVWMTQERCFRQAMKQDTAFGRYVQEAKERAQRREDRRHGHFIGRR